MERAAIAVVIARVAKPKVTMSVSEPFEARAAHCAACSEGAASLGLGQTLIRTTSSSVHTTEKRIETVMPALVLLRASESKLDQDTVGWLEEPPEVPPPEPPLPELGHDDEYEIQLPEL